MYKGWPKAPLWSVSTLSVVATPGECEPAVERKWIGLTTAVRAVRGKRADGTVERIRRGLVPADFYQGSVGQYTTYPLTAAVGAVFAR
jgi:hypothetical protein